MLVRYSGDYVLSDLENHRLSVSKFSSFNDPFELHFKKGARLTTAEASRQFEFYRKTAAFISVQRRKHPGLTDKQLKRVVQQRKAFFVAQMVANYDKTMDKQRAALDLIIDARARAMCFAEVGADTSVEIPMWGYYADGHKGFRVHCASTVTDDPRFQLHKVGYPDTPPAYNIINHANKPALLKNLIEIVTNKGKAWAHEREHRLIISIGATFAEKDGKDVLRDYIGIKAADILRIDCGIRCSDSNVKRAIALRALYPALAVFRAVPIEDAYSIGYVEVV